MSSLQEVEMDHESLKKLINLNWLGMKSITNIQEEDAVGKGENYGSVMRRLKITGVDKEGKTARKNLVVKKDKVNQGVELAVFFSLEIQIYTEFLPKFEVLIKNCDKTFFPDTLWAVCCGVRNHDLIILEDLVEAGYSMRNRRVPLSEEVATFCAEQLGKFHGLSHVAVKRKLIDPNTLGPNKYAINMPIFNNIFSSGLQTLADCIENDAEWKSIVPKLRAIAKDVGNVLIQAAEKVKDIFPVINHGDCWTNNMLFKYKKDTDTPIALKFVDFQVSHYSCFAWDLTNLMHASMSAQTRQHCYKKMIEKYRMSLVKTLEILKEDISEVPDLNTMLQVMDHMAPFGLVIAFSYFPLTINTMKTSWDEEKTGKTESTSTHPPELYDNEIFKESFKIDAERFKKLGLL